MTIAICAGSFDPPTNGHVDLIARGSRLFDRVVVGVLVNPAKTSLLSAEERVELLRGLAAPFVNVEVAAFDGLLVDFARARGASAILRGLRSGAEFDEEAPMATTNRHLGGGLETCFLVSSPSVAFISSRLVKEIAALGGALDGLVPASVKDALHRRRSGPPA
jgi:pantetheine-phosphate adenylyltransferase